VAKRLLYPGDKCHFRADDTDHLCTLIQYHDKLDKALVQYPKGLQVVRQWVPVKDLRIQRVDK